MGFRLQERAGQNGQYLSEIIYFIIGSRYTYNLKEWIFNSMSLIFFSTRLTEETNVADHFSSPCVLDIYTHSTHTTAILLHTLIAADWLNGFLIFWFTNVPWNDLYLWCEFGSTNIFDSVIEIIDNEKLQLVFINIRKKNR